MTNKNDRSDKGVDRVGFASGLVPDWNPKAPIRKKGTHVQISAGGLGGLDDSDADAVNPFLTTRTHKVAPEVPEHESSKGQRNLLCKNEVRTYS